MPLTKLTPRKESKCPMCRFKTYDMAEMTRHITECGLKHIERKFSCDREDCNFTTNKMGNLTRHKKRQEGQNDDVRQITSSHYKNQKSDKETASESSPSADCNDKNSTSQDAGEGKAISDEEWIDADPGDLRSILGDVSETDNEREEDPNAKQVNEDANIGRIFRKPTTPMPIFAPKRKNPLVASSGLPARPLVRKPQVCVTGTQTERKIRRVEWTITKWREGERDFEHIVMIEED
ncbi:uncharacterized protein LOC133204279 [Saccostrea echinata]|uniref:uncharacterized protein LOC133204279 n=1 Tax=Saccostrea echinata TaxID=191078 RepID=UPI002A816CA9|nr:uncharacterized protein LOC133204279 [Saccostrea echinata]